MSTTATTTASTAASTPAMLKSTTKLAFEEPRDEDSSALGQILMDAFATSSRAIFGPLDADVLEYRTSLVRQRVGLMRLYNAGKVDTCHRFMLARDTSSHAVVGFAIWSLEDDWSEGGVNKRESEVDLAPPLSATPKGANPVMFDRCQEEMTRMQRVYMQDRRRCYLKYLCIDSKVQRSGAGSALLSIVRRDAGDRPIFLEAADTPSAVNFYKRLNFDDMGVYTVGELVFNGMKLEPSVSSPLDAIDVGVTPFARAIVV